MGLRGSHFHGKTIAGPFGHELVRWSGQGKGRGACNSHRCLQDFWKQTYAVSNIFIISSYFQSFSILISWNTTIIQGCHCSTSLVDLGWPGSGEAVGSHQHAERSHRGQDFCGGWRRRELLGYSPPKKSGKPRSLSIRVFQVELVSMVCLFGMGLPTPETSQRACALQVPCISNVWVIPLGWS